MDYREWIIAREIKGCAKYVIGDYLRGLSREEGGLLIGTGNPLVINGTMAW